MEIGILAILILFITSIVMLIARDWRITLATLAVIYIAVFLLINQIWPLPLAIVKLIAGWIACIVLGMASLKLPVYFDAKGSRSFNSFLSTAAYITKQAVSEFDRIRTDSRTPLGNFFAVFAALFIFLAAVAIAYRFTGNFVLVNFFPLLGGIFLVAMGLLQVGFTNHPLYISTGLLTILAGFEILYALIDSSVLVAGLLSGTNLGLALIGAYLISAPGLESLE